VAFGVIHEPGTLAVEVFVNFVQRVPQLSGRRGCRAMAALTLAEMHELPDPHNGDLSVLCLAVPDPPVQPFNLLDNVTFAAIRPGSSIDNPLAACFAGWRRIAT
jgi:hypothetical protein